MKIIHLSDLHIGYKHKNEIFPMTGRVDKIIDYLIALKVPHREYTIVITGDMVDNAFNDENYETARELIGKLKEKFRVFMVPGNHDYGTGVMTNKKFIKKFKKYFLEDDVEYPKVDLIDDIVFIGLDSMAEEVNWYDTLGANGELGKEQLNRLDKIIDRYKNSKKVVYLHHHPFHPTFLHELKDSESLGKVVANRIDALLFGHNHAGDNLNGGKGWNIKRCYDGGSSTRKEKSRSATRIIDLNDEPRSDYMMEIITDSDLER